MRAGLVLLLVLFAWSGCPRERAGKGGGDRGEKSDEIETTTLGEVRVGKESAQLYVAYSFDAALLGLSVSTGAGPRRHFPLFASTYRGIPPVVLEVFASKSETELWIRSSWPDGEILAHHRVGAETALTPWGEMKALEKPMPDHLGGGPVPFPALVVEKAVKKATFKLE